jgi:hypothetical protein
MAWFPLVRWKPVARYFAYSGHGGFT